MFVALCQYKSARCNFDGAGPVYKILVWFGHYKIFQNVSDEF